MSAHISCLFISLTNYIMSAIVVRATLSIHTVIILYTLIVALFEVTTLVRITTSCHTLKGIITVVFKVLLRMEAY